MLQVNNCPSDHLPTSSIHTVALFIMCALKVVVHGAMDGSKASMLTALVTMVPVTYVAMLMIESHVVMVPVTYVAMLMIESHVAMVLPAMIMIYS